MLYLVSDKIFARLSIVLLLSTAITVLLVYTGCFLDSLTLLTAGSYGFPIMVISMLAWITYIVIYDIKHQKGLNEKHDDETKSGNMMVVIIKRNDER